MKELYFTSIYLFLLALTAIAIPAFRNRDKRHLFRYIIAGHLCINLPIILLILGIPAAIYLAFGHTAWRFVFIPIGFMAGLGVAWITWSLLIPKWRIWAFRRISEEDLPELKKMAIANRLIWDDGSRLEGTEIQSGRDKEIIREINEHILFLEGIDELQADLSTGPETIFQANRRDMKVELTCKGMLVLLAVGMISMRQVIPGVLLLSAVAVTGRNPFLLKKHWNDTLTISDRGIRVKGIFYNWGEMNRIQPEGEYEGIRITLRAMAKPIVVKFHNYRISDRREVMSIVKLHLARYIEIRNILSGELN